jgi:hypothetical protein
MLLLLIQYAGMHEAGRVRSAPASLHVVEFKASGHRGLAAVERHASYGLEVHGMCTHFRSYKAPAPAWSGSCTHLTYRNRDRAKLLAACDTCCMPPDHEHVAAAQAGAASQRDGQCQSRTAGAAALSAHASLSLWVGMHKRKPTWYQQLARADAAGNAYCVRCYLRLDPARTWRVCRRRYSL